MMKPWRSLAILMVVAGLAVIATVTWGQPKPVAPVTPATAPIANSAAPSTRAVATAPATPEEPDTVVVDQKTEEVIKGALKYLAAKQMANGAWSSSNGEHPVAVTAYTLMAFLATGNLPNEGDYGKNVTNGTQFLLNCVRADGYICSEGAAAGKKSSNMYDHGIGTIALAEIYGQTQDPKIREKLSLAIKLILKSQNKEGGWRYSPRPESADISVTVLQVVALRAAKNSGLEVPQITIDKAVEYVKSCQDAKSGGFCYQPGQGAGFARTAAAIYSLQVCGLYDDPMVKRGSDYIIKDKRNHIQWFTYGHFYAAPAHYMIGGKVWKEWYNDIRTILLNKEKLHVESNLTYWDTIDNDGRGVGPVYATAVYTTILATPYHYIPLYQR